MFPWYQINESTLDEIRFFHAILLLKICFNSEYACRISSIHMIRFLAFFLLFLAILHWISFFDPWYQINDARLDNIRHFYTTLLQKRSFNSEYACRISLIHMIWFYFFSALSMHLTLNIGIWIHCTKSMWRDYVNSVFLYEITNKNKFQHWIRVSNKFN